MNTKLSESNGAYIALDECLVPACCVQEAVNGLWWPKRGVWYTAEKRGKIGGGWGGAGSGAWHDKGINVFAGDKFRLKSRGNAACPSVWEVEFTSPLR
jgi:hypothetical protein